jgi:hypothetical protein
MRTTILAVAAALIGAIGVTPASAGAQCGFYYDCSAGGDHRLPATGLWMLYPHDDCGVCIVGDCHPPCTLDDDFASNPSFKKAYKAIVEAASKGDVMRILQLAPKAAGYVLYNPERQSVQLRGCSVATVLASLPVRDDAIRRLASLLPNAAEVLGLATLAPDRAKPAIVASGSMRD